MHRIPQSVIGFKILVHITPVTLTLTLKIFMTEEVPTSVAGVNLLSSMLWTQNDYSATRCSNIASSIIKMPLYESLYGWKNIWR